MTMPNFLRRRPRARSLSDLGSLIESSVQGSQDGRQGSSEACEGSGLLLIQTQPSAALAARCGAAVVRAAAGFDRCRLAARDARVKAVCQSWTSRLFSALRAAEKTLSEANGSADPPRLLRWDACDTLLCAMHTARSVLRSIMESSAGNAQLESAALDAFFVLTMALEAEAAPTVGHECEAVL
ncbi:hypothetical protein [Paraburkholderia sp. A1RO-5L]|uniref:hypothetical protein n=1 Tax=Paraburkholderia sp. A1RO-5L TaxID=3028370 RepID=UPI003B7C8604